ncbi:MAG: hypothetical protein R3C25_05335 [Hyphomonadaceae bacterium]
MFAFLIAVRDVLVAMALAWVGVSLQAAGERQSACAGEACQQDADR